MRGRGCALDEFVHETTNRSYPVQINGRWVGGRRERWLLTKPALRIRYHQVKRDRIAKAPPAPVGVGRVAIISRPRERRARIRRAPSRSPGGGDSDSSGEPEPPPLVAGVAL